MKMTKLPKGTERLKRKKNNKKGPNNTNMQTFSVRCNKDDNMKKLQFYRHIKRVQLLGYQTI